MKTIKQISVFLENTKGRLTQVTKILNENGVDISAFSVADSSEFGILRMIVNDAQKAYNVLKGANFTTILTDVVALEMSMGYGSLHQILNILNKADIQIEYMYAFPFKNKESEVERCTMDWRPFWDFKTRETGFIRTAIAVIRTSDLEKTILVLEQQNQQLLCENDINN